MKTLENTKTIKHAFDWNVLLSQADATKAESKVSGTIAAIWTERDNLSHVLIKTENGYKNVDAYTGFLFEPSPDGVQAKVGETIEMTLDTRLGQMVRAGWQNLNVERAFAPVSEAWKALAAAIDQDEIVPAHVYGAVSVTDFFGILFEDEPSFAEDEEAA